MQLKKLSEEEISDLGAVIDNEGFWYSLTDGGYLSPENYVENEEDIEKLKEAIEIIKEFENKIMEITEY